MVKDKFYNLVAGALVAVFVLTPVFGVPRKAEAQLGLSGVSGYVQGLGPAIAKLPQCKEHIDGGVKSLFRGIGNLVGIKGNKTTPNAQSKPVEKPKDQPLGMSDEEFESIAGEEFIQRAKEEAKRDLDRMINNSIEERVRSASAEVDSISVQDKQVIEELKKIRGETTKTAAATEKMKQNTSCINSIGRLIARMLLQKLTVSTVNWINGGFDGSPQYIQDPGKFFGNIAKYEILQFGLQIDNNELFPFGREWLRNTANQFNRKFTDNARYSLDELIRQTTPEYSAITFREDFSKGGWNAWTALTQVPANNPIGFELMANNEIQSLLRGTSQSRAEGIREGLQAADGFLGQERCTYPEGMEGRTRSEEQELLKEGKIKSSELCQEWRYVTPGALIANAATKSIDQPYVSLWNVEDLNDAIAAILDAIMGQLFPTLIEKGYAALYPNSLGADGRLVFASSNTRPYRSRTERDFAPIHLSSSWLQSNPDFDIRTDLTQALVDEQRTYIDKLKAQNKELFSTTDGKEYKISTDPREAYGERWYSTSPDNKSGGWALSSDTGTWTAESGTGGVDTANWMETEPGAGVWTSKTGSGKWTSGSRTRRMYDGTWNGKPDGKSGTFAIGTGGGTWVATSGTGGIGNASWTYDGSVAKWTSSSGQGIMTGTGIQTVGAVGTLFENAGKNTIASPNDGTWYSKGDGTQGTFATEKGVGDWTATTGKGGTDKMTWKSETNNYTASWTSTTGAGKMNGPNLLINTSGTIWGINELNTLKSGVWPALNSGYVNKGLSNAYGLLPAIYQLDYCIPGPHPGWEEDARRALNEVLDKVIPETEASIEDRENESITGIARSIAPLAGSALGAALIGTSTAAGWLGLSLGAAAGPVGMIAGAAIGAILGAILGGTSPEKKIRLYYSSIIYGMTGLLPDWKSGNDTYSSMLSSKNGLVHIMNEILNRYITIMNKTYFSSSDMLPSVAKEAAQLFDQARGYQRMMQINEERIASLTTTVNILSDIKAEVDKLNAEYRDGEGNFLSEEAETVYEEKLKPQINAFGRLSADMVNGDDIAAVDNLLRQIIDKKSYIYKNLIKGPYGCEAFLQDPKNIKKFPGFGGLPGNRAAADWGNYDINSVQRARYPLPIIYDYNAFDFLKSNVNAELPNPWAYLWGPEEEKPASTRVPDANANLDTSRFSMYDEGNVHRVFGPGFLSFVRFSSTSEGHDGTGDGEDRRGPETLYVADLFPHTDNEESRFRPIGEINDPACNRKWCKGIFESIIGIY